MQTSTYLQFTRTIKAGGRFREFNFLRRLRNDIITYDTDVADERGNRFIFEMKKIDDQWTIVGKDLPSWITESQSTLHDVIEGQKINGEN